MYFLSLPTSPIVISRNLKRHTRRFDPQISRYLDLKDVSLSLSLFSRACVYVYVYMRVRLCTTDQQQ